MWESSKRREWKGRAWGVGKDIFGGKGRARFIIFERSGRDLFLRGGTYVIISFEVKQKAKHELGKQFRHRGGVCKK